jgi:anthranilate phosphoribosyltransferase
MACGPNCFRLGAKRCALEDESQRMNLAKYLKQIGHGAGSACDLSEDDAHELFAAMLDGGLPDLELGAALMALRMKTGSVAELLGFWRAMSERVYALRAPFTPLKPLVFATYNGARTEPNLLPLLALMLQRLGVPVLLHGTLEGSGRVATIYILREMGVLPCATQAQAQQRLESDLLVFVPTAALCPGLANLLALRGRLGLRNTAHNLVKLLDPFESPCVRVVSATDAYSLNRLAQFFVACGADALLLQSTEGEAFANPRRRPRIRHLCDSVERTLFEEEAGPPRVAAGLPAAVDAATTATWMRLVLAGEMPVPHPIMNQLACCLYACGYTDDLNQAKAIAAVETGGLVPPGKGASRSRAAVD